MSNLGPPANGIRSAPLSHADPTAPPQVRELAEACARYVHAALGVTLDYDPETLPIVDHYVSSRRQELRDRPEAAGLVARFVAAYFGEVVRRRVESFWHLPSDDATRWQLRLVPVYLALNPYEIASDAISLGDQGEPTARLELDDDDREAVEERLAELPEATDEEFFSLSTRLEVLEIAVDAIKAKMLGSGLGDVVFSAEDYDRDSPRD
jgi:hypothetical protein